MITDTIPPPLKPHLRSTQLPQLGTLIPPNQPMPSNHKPFFLRSRKPQCRLSIRQLLIRRCLPYKPPKPIFESIPDIRFRHTIDNHMLDFLHKGDVTCGICGRRDGEKFGDRVSGGRGDLWGYADSACVDIEEEVPPFRVVFKEGVCYTGYVSGARSQHITANKVGNKSKEACWGITRSEDYRLY